MAEPALLRLRRGILAVAANAVAANAVAATAVAATAVAANAVAATAAPPPLRRAELSQASAAGGLAPTIERLAAATRGPAWLAWEVVRIESAGRPCCFTRDGDGDVCPLESERGWTTDDRPGRPDGGGLAVLARARDGRIETLRAFAADCPLDAGGLPFVWLGEIDAGESVDWLARLAVESAAAGDAALAAVAFHGSPRADDVLLGVATGGGSRRARESAVFWLGEARGRTGFLALERLLAERRERWLRAKAVFALSLSREPQAGRRLVELARADGDAEIRREALFWLAQRGQPGAAEVVLAAIEQDPSRAVRVHAVFALSQLPAGQATPALLRVLRGGGEAELRQQALFWLGQSRDPEAMAVLERLLLRDPPR
jgi:hypothetical protein